MASSLFEGGRVPLELSRDAAAVIAALVLRAKGEVTLTEEELLKAQRATLNWHRDGAKRAITFTVWNP